MENPRQMYWFTVATSKKMKEINTEPEESVSDYEDQEQQDDMRSEAMEYEQYMDANTDFNMESN